MARDPERGDPLQEYLALYDEAAGQMFVELDGAIREAAPELEVAIKYRLLSYTVERDWRHWVCAVNATKSAVCLRFLWGVLLDDPLRVLRPGTSTLMTWDIPRGGAVDTAAVGSYVREALAKRDHFLAHEREISAEARARTRTR
jgi:hypothetical protein